MNKKNKLILLLMVTLALMISVPKTLAYFSTYVQAKGAAPVVLKEVVEFKEEKIGGNKRVVIKADSDSDPIYVRIRAYASSEIFDLIDFVFEEGEWRMTTDGWYEYYKVLMAGEEASMDIEIEKASIELSQFNVIVVYEYIPAISDGEGGYVKDWSVGWTTGGDGQ